MLYLVYRMTYFTTKQSKLTSVSILFVFFRPVLCSQFPVTGLNKFTCLQSHNKQFSLMVLIILTSKLHLFPLNEFVGCTQLNGQLWLSDWYMNSFTCSLMHHCMIYFSVWGWLGVSFMNIFIGGWVKWSRICSVYGCTLCAG